MSDRTTNAPTSLEDLLSANKDRFDALFQDQMSGGRAARTAQKPSRTAKPPTSVASSPRKPARFDAKPNAS